MRQMKVKGEFANMATGHEEEPKAMSLEVDSAVAWGKMIN